MLGPGRIEQEGIGPRTERHRVLPGGHQDVPDQLTDGRAARLAGQQDGDAGRFGRSPQAARLDRLARALGALERDEPATGFADSPDGV